MAPAPVAHFDLVSPSGFESEALRGRSFSASERRLNESTRTILDARYEKVREAGVIVGQGCWLRWRSTSP